MELQDSLFFSFCLLLVAVYILVLFLWKYYDIFQLRDKIIIAYLGILAQAGILVFLCFNHPSSNSFFIAWLPFMIIAGIYRVIKMHRSRENVIIHSFRDQVIIRSLQMLGFASWSLYSCFTDKSIFMFAIPLIAVVHGIHGLKKIYRAEKDKMIG